MRAAVARQRAAPAPALRGGGAGRLQRPATARLWRGDTATLGSACRVARSRTLRHHTDRPPARHVGRCMYCISFMRAAVWPRAGRGEGDGRGRLPPIFENEMRENRNAWIFIHSSCMPSCGTRFGTPARGGGGGAGRAGGGAGGRAHQISLSVSRGGYAPHRGEVATKVGYFGVKSAKVHL